MITGQWRWWSRAVLVAGLAGGGATELAAGRITIAWPTPNRAYAERQPLEEWVQPNESGLIESGLFGCTRGGGAQFHEGLDLFPVNRDTRGEAKDDIYAVMDGVVRHVSTAAGPSSYGRYLVIEHDGTRPAVLTLYAHLAAVSDGLVAGRRVRGGEVIATMGRSAGGYTIPRERAHLHFEMGVRLTDDFQAWYNWRQFGSRNEHTVWNGMNLVGFDPLAFYDAFRAHEVNNLGEFFRAQAAAVTVRVATRNVPDYVRRYPSLVTRLWAPELLAGWEVAIGAEGLPWRWTPLTAEEVGIGVAENTVTVVSVDEVVRDRCRCKRLVRRQGGGWVPDRDLHTLLQLVFGMRR